MTTDHTPDPADDLAGCLDALAQEYGDHWVFQLISRIRDNHHGTTPATAFRHAAAVRMVEAEMRRNGHDEDAAIRTVGEGLGYKRQTRAKVPGQGTMTNFRKIYRGVDRTGQSIGAQ